MLNKPPKGQARWPLVLRRGLLVACWWCAVVAGAVGVPQSRESVGGSGVDRVRLAARPQPAVYVPAVPACMLCPAMLRPEDELKIRFQVFGRKGQATRLRVSWGDGSERTGDWDATGKFSVKLTHRYKRSGCVPYSQLAGESTGKAQCALTVQP